MLKIKNFYSGCNDYHDYLSYEGSKIHCFVYENGKNYQLDVLRIGEMKTEKYVCSSLHTAIEQIELMENGIEI